MQATEQLQRLAAVIARLSTAGCTPHPQAASLTLPNGELAPAVLGAWAAYDNEYPSYLASRRTGQPIADQQGNVLVVPMADVLGEICIDDVREELGLDDDDKEARETLAYLEEIVTKALTQFTGYGAVVEPREHPDRFIWMGPEKTATIVHYEDDAFESRQDFVVWIERLFADD